MAIILRKNQNKICFYFLGFFSLLFLLLLLPLTVKATDTPFYENSITGSNNYWTNEQSNAPDYFLAASYAEVSYRFYSSASSTNISKIEVSIASNDETKPVYAVIKNSLCEVIGTSSASYIPTGATTIQSFNFDTPINISTSTTLYISLSAPQNNIWVRSSVGYGVESQFFWGDCSLRYNYTGFYLKAYYDPNYTGPEPEPIIIAFNKPNLFSSTTLFTINQSKIFNVFYNTCQVYENLDSAKIQTKLSTRADWTDGVEVISPKSEFIGPQLCKSNINSFIDPQIATDVSATGTAQFRLVTYDTAGNIISSSTSNIITYETPNTINYIDYLGDNPFLFNIGDTVGTTTRLYFIWDFTGRTASTSVCLWDFQQATTTAYCNNMAYANTGFNWIDIPTPTLQTHKLYRFIATTPGLITLQSAIMNITWWFAPVQAKVCKYPDVSIDHICDDIDTSNLLGQIKCAIKASIVGAGTFLFYPNCDSITEFQNGYEDIKATFPFNTYFEFTDAVKEGLSVASSSTTTASISLPMIQKTTTTLQMIPIFSSTSLPNLIGSQNYQNYYKTLSYIYWLVAGLLVYITVKKI